MKSVVEYLPEPQLRFGNGQTGSNPKIGLYFFGPSETRGRPKHIKTGVVGTPSGIKLYKEWARTLDRYVAPLVEDSTNHVPYPGFAALTGATIAAEPERQVTLSAAKLARAIRLGRRHEAVKEAVAVVEEALRENLEDDVAADVWFVVVPDEIYRYGRPKSVVPKSEAVKSGIAISKRRVNEILSGAPSLFDDENRQAETFLYEPNFHNQLKARLLDRRDVVLQIVRESTLEMMVHNDPGVTKRRLQDPASIAWNLATTLYFKAGGQPWKLDFVRPRVCYIGLVFKLFPDTADDLQKACCGAQMFLDSGDGLVFRGTPGKYYDPKTKQFHLTRDAARTLICDIVAAYRNLDADDLPPTELVIHGRTRFNNEEWMGFSEGAPQTKITTVRISETSDIRLYAPRDTPVLRGTTLRLSERKGYLWTKGFVSELGTYQGREVPRPLAVEVVNGDTTLEVVMRDLLMLTKLNFNSCVYADGMPVTLRFADTVGDIITSVPEKYAMLPGPPMPFKHYI